MEITIYRDLPLAREESQLPAATYNLLHTLLARSPGALFVPIRPMQFLAIADADEIVFVDHLQKSLAAVAWQGFRRQERDALDVPVAYTAVYYRDDGAELMKRLQGELPRALSLLEGKEKPEGPAKILKFERKAPG